jgi:AraC-like DNA-binding protein
MAFFSLGWMISLKTTGLQFGYFFGLLFFLIFIIRGIKEERLSDVLLGFIMFFMAMLLQDYTFGFVGINYLWEELDGWPRHFPWIFPATVYFYFLAQTNVQFKFSKSHSIHLLPYILYLVLSILLIIFGLTPSTGLFSSPFRTYWHVFYYVINYGGIFYYFIKCIKIYKNYKSWTENEYSNTYALELKWLRNFLLFFLIGAILHLVNSIVDLIFDLPYDQDYYWQLFTVVTIIYVGISGLLQDQERNIMYKVHEKATEKLKVRVNAEEYLALKEKLQIYMNAKKPYLNPDLTLRDLASQLSTNTTSLSALINSNFEKNFNDFINEYRVLEFERAIKDASNKNLTLVAIAYDCGFNSKATFNRAVKKVTGKMPSEL